MLFDVPECCDYPMDIIGYYDENNTDIYVYGCQINETHSTYYNSKGEKVPS